MLTAVQMRKRTKTVTRRLNWLHAVPGMEVLAVSKCQGLKPGEQAERFGVIRFVSVRRERLGEMANSQYGDEEARREGFPDGDGKDFIDFFCDFNDCKPSQQVTRIEFEFV